MDQNHLVSQLSEILQMTQESKEQTEVEAEKLQVALTGVLRLLAVEENSPLIKMQGAPEDLKGYILRLVSDFRGNMKSRWEILSSKIQLVLQDARNA